MITILWASLCIFNARGRARRSDARKHAAHELCNSAAFISASACLVNKLFLFWQQDVSVNNRYLIRSCPPTDGRHLLCLLICCIIQNNLPSRFLSQRGDKHIRIKAEKKNQGCCDRLWHTSLNIYLAQRIRNASLCSSVRRDMKERVYRRRAQRKQTHTQRRDNPIVESKHRAVRTDHPVMPCEEKRLENGPAWWDREREPSDSRVMERLFV